MGAEQPLTHSQETVAAAVADLAAALDLSDEYAQAMTRLLTEYDEQTALNAIKTAPMLTRLRDGSRWNLEMASRGAQTEEVEGAAVLRFPRKPGDRCEVTFIAGDVEITTRH